MSCKNCMNHKPYGADRFTCPDCGQIWVLAGVGPGNYWEPLETKQREEAKTQEFINEFRNKNNV